MHTESDSLMTMMRIMTTHVLAKPGLVGPWLAPGQCPEHGCVHAARRHRHKIPWSKVIRRAS